MRKVRGLIIGTVSLGLLSGSLLSLPSLKKNVEKVNAYDPSGLPTTIDLNDALPQTIRNYYASLTSLDESERQGMNLLKNLKPILKNNQEYYGYDSSQGDKIWRMYEITDRDWVKSPATDLAGYNSETKIITGYSYGTHYTTPGTNPYIHALYVNREGVDNGMRAWDIGTGENAHGDNKEWYFDREHIWQKSQGFEASGAGGARGDPMHLWPGDSYVNSALHNDQMYGYVDKSKSYTDGADKYSYTKYNYLGISQTLGTTLSTQKVFEPQDSDKGDIARAIFYMVARYNFLSGSDEDGINSNNPNLELVQNNDVLSGYTSSTTNTGKIGIMTDLLNWHHLDPVDQYEIHRNNILFNNYTKNRNPFIDFPEWVDYIWGTARYNGRQYQSYNSNPTGYAKPGTDTINGYNETPIEPATSITATANRTFKVGETITKNDITVEDNNGYLVEDFEFTNYQFTYADAASGGALTNKSLNVTYGTLSTTVTAQVKREAHITTLSVSDTLNKTKTGVTGNTYNSWTDVVDQSGAVYAGNTAGGNGCIQLRNSNNAGIVITSNTKKVLSVEVSWYTNAGTGTKFSIFGKNTAYESSADLYSSTASVKGTSLGTITKGTSTSLNISGTYTYIGMRSTDAAMYLNSITITYEIEDTALNLSNYIMFEDTVGQCNTKFSVAKGYFEGLSSTQRSIFMTSSDVVISCARDRLEDWATALGKTITYINGDYEITNKSNAIISDHFNKNVYFFIIIGVISVSGTGLYFLLKKKKRMKEDK